jgi:hypothetical protein
LAKVAKKPPIPGQRVGTKKTDTRWQAPDGTVWASRFEFAVFTKLKEAGYNVRKTTEQDRFAYTSPVKGGKCTVCASHDVVTERTYTPDLFVVPAGAASDDEGYFIEAKGYLRSERRALLRSFRKTGPRIDLRLVVQRDYKVGKSTLVGWATRLLKVPVHVWNGDLPNEWK